MNNNLKQVKVSKLRLNYTNFLGTVTEILETFKNSSDVIGHFNILFKSTIAETSLVVLQSTTFIVLSCEMFNCSRIKEKSLGF